MPNASLVNSSERKGSSRLRVLFSRKKPKRASLMRVGPKTCWSEIASVRLRSARRRVKGEAGWTDPEMSRVPGNWLKKKVPLSVLLFTQPTIKTSGELVLLKLRGPHVELLHQRVVFPQRATGDTWSGPN